MKIEIERLHTPAIPNKESSIYFVLSVNGSAIVSGNARRVLKTAKALMKE